MSPRAIRIVVVAVCVSGIAGMIVSSIADNTGAAMTFGVVTAVAVLVLVAVTAVSPRTGVREEDAERLEAAIQQLVATGADENAVRDLVKLARRV